MKPLRRKSVVGIVIVLSGLIITFESSSDTRAGEPAPAIQWLDLTQSSAPGRVDQLRMKLEDFVTTVSLKIGFRPETILSTGHFYRYDPTIVGELIPLALSTNVDGTLAAILTPTAYSNLVQRLNDSEGTVHLGSPRIGNMERRKGVISSSQSIRTSDGPATIVYSMDLISDLSGTNVHTRLIGQVTKTIKSPEQSDQQANTRVQNAVVPVLQAGLESSVPLGGGIVMWKLADDDASTGHLLLLSSSIMNGLPALPKKSTTVGE